MHPLLLQVEGQGQVVVAKGGSRARGDQGSKQSGVGPGGVDAWLSGAQPLGVEERRTGKQHHPSLPLPASGLRLVPTTELGGQHLR